MNNFEITMLNVWHEIVRWMYSHQGQLQSIVVILIVTWIVQRFIIWWILKRSKAESSIVINFIRWGIVLTGIVFVLNVLGQPITPILTALGVGGLAVALGLQDTLTNVFAGLNILASKKMKLGDEIELPSKKQGIITDITWRHTILKTETSTIIVPNSYVVKEVIENFGKPDKDKAKKKK